jgi:hypothetical protein
LRVARKTRERIMQAVAELGYVPDAHLSNLMGYLRKIHSEQTTKHESVAYLTSEPSLETDIHKLPFFRKFRSGAQGEMDRLGYRMEIFKLRDYAFNLKRVESVLKSRNIQGIIVSPPVGIDDLKEFHWDGFAAITLGYRLSQPGIHRVASDQIHEHFPFGKSGRFEMLSHNIAHPAVAHAVEDDKLVGMPGVVVAVPIGFPEGDRAEVFRPGLADPSTIGITLDSSQRKCFALPPRVLHAVVIMTTQISASGPSGEFFDKVMGLEVLDTHTHLIGGKLAARDFWEIGEYFWLKEELIAAGYPADAESLPEDRRREAYARAFAATRNTSMNTVTSAVFRDLYDLEITDAASVARADRAVRESAAREDWPEKVVDRLRIRRMVVNREEHAPFPELPGRALWVPRIDGVLNRRLAEIRQNGGLREDIVAAGEELAGLATESAAKGAPGVMSTLPGLEGPVAESLQKSTGELAAEGNSADQALGHCLHRVCEAAVRAGIFFQLFLGIERGHYGRTVPVSDPRRLLKLYGVFASHSCPFELVLGSHINNLDAVQTCRLFPHVRLGGLWWYNFRVSRFDECMHQRFEALPACRSAFVVSDARCIEWCYGKIWLIKRLTADFLAGQIRRGFISEEDALTCAARVAARRPGPLV